MRQNFMLCLGDAAAKVFRIKSTNFKKWNQDSVLRATNKWKFTKIVEQSAIKQNNLIGDRQANHHLRLTNLCDYPIPPIQHWSSSGLWLTQ